MISEIIFAAFVDALSIKGMTKQVASDAVLKNWTEYKQGNRALQKALRISFEKTASALAVALVPSKLKLSPKLSKEFTDAIEERYLQPFCEEDEIAREKLKKIAIKQCKLLNKFLMRYEFEDVSPKQMANFLYNVRFIDEESKLKQQKELTHDKLKEDLLSTGKFEKNFVEFLFFGNSVFYEGVIFFLEKTIRVDEILNEHLAYFHKKKILAEIKKKRIIDEEIREKIDELKVKIKKFTESENFEKVTELGDELAELKEQKQKLDKFLVIAEKNEKLWQYFEEKLVKIEKCFGVIRFEDTSQSETEKQPPKEQEKEPEKETVKPTSSPSTSPSSSKQKTIEGIEFVLVEGGTFMMGDNDSEYDREKPEHKVTVDSFYVGKYPVTNQQYADFLNEYGSTKVKQGEYKGESMIEEHEWGVKQEKETWSSQEGYEDHPVVKVSWYGAHEFAKYYGFRLPTEAEWEYAARGGIKSNGYKYAGSDNVEEVAWYFENAGDKTHSVRELNPNELGIYDMSGNIWEWCADWYDENYYKNSPENNPQGGEIDDFSEEYRVLRGGSWYDVGVNLTRVSTRSYNYPDRKNYLCGFRVVKNFSD